MNTLCLTSRLLLSSLILMTMWGCSAQKSATSETPIESSFRQLDPSLENETATQILQRFAEQLAAHETFRNARYEWYEARDGQNYLRLATADDHVGQMAYTHWPEDHIILWVLAGKDQALPEDGTALGFKSAFDEDYDQSFSLYHFNGPQGYGDEINGVLVDGATVQLFESTTPEQMRTLIEGVLVRGLPSVALPED